MSCKVKRTAQDRLGKQLPPSTSVNDDDRQRATICTAKTFPSLDHGLGLQWLMRVHYSVLITIKSELKRKSESRLNLVFDFATHDATPDECNSIQPWWSSACIVASQRVQQLIREKPINMRKGRGRGAGRWSWSRGIISIVLLLIPLLTPRVSYLKGIRDLAGQHMQNILSLMRIETFTAYLVRSIFLVYFWSAVAAPMEFAFRLGQFVWPAN